MKNAMFTVGLFVLTFTASCYVGIPSIFPIIQEGYTVAIERENEITYLVFSDFFTIHSNPELHNTKWKTAKFVLYSGGNNETISVQYGDVKLEDDGMYHIETAVPSDQDVSISFSVVFPPPYYPGGSDRIDLGPFSCGF